MISTRNNNTQSRFIIKKSKLVNRWDPYYHQPFFEAIEQKIKANPWTTLHQQSNKILSGITPESGSSAYCEKEQGVPFIRSGDFNEDGSINWNDIIYIKDEIHNGIMRRSRLCKGDILFAIVGATIGKVGIYQYDREANINQAVCAVRLSNALRSEYVHAFFLTPAGKELIDRIKRPVARANINLGEISSLIVPKISDAKQRVVAEALTNAFRKKKKIEQEASRLLESIDTIFLRELGVKLPAEPPNTIKSRIFQRRISQVTGKRLDPLYHQKDVFEFVRKAKYPLTNLGENVLYFQTGFAAGRNDQGEEETGIVQIRPTNLSNDRELIFDRNIYISSKEIEKRRTDILERGEVLFNNTNSQELVGKTVYFDIEGNYFCSNHITRIQTKKDSLDPQFLGHVLNLYQRKKAFFKICINWNNQSGVGVDILRTMPIPLPSPSRQKKIVNRIDQVRNDAKEMKRKSLMELEKAKKEIESIILDNKGKS